PNESIAIPHGWIIAILVAGEPSPVGVGDLLPATVAITPVAPSTRRIVFSRVSVMKRLLLASTATPEGAQTADDVAGPPSPALLARHSASVLGPLPAKVVMIPVCGSTRRTRSFHVS